jgi:predicted nucleic acid-binding protein
MTQTIYLDTSALAKWYLNEDMSEDVEDYIRQHGPVAVSDLTMVEMRSLLARHRREKQISAAMELRVFGTFQEDMRHGHLTCHGIPQSAPAAAIHIISVLPRVALRALDALHLAIAKEIQADVLVTSDRLTATAARSIGLKVIQFLR